MFNSLIILAILVQMLLGFHSGKFYDEDTEHQIQVLTMLNTIFFAMCFILKEVAWKHLISRFICIIFIVVVGSMMYNFVGSLPRGSFDSIIIDGWSNG